MSESIQLLDMHQLSPGPLCRYIEFPVHVKWLLINSDKDVKLWNFSALAYYDMDLL